MRIVEVVGSTVRHAVMILRRRDTALQFMLVPMTHVACPEFYEQVRRRLSACDLIVAEGFQDRSWQVGVLTMAYRFMPRRRRNGLVLQDDAMLLPPGVPVVVPDVTAAQAVADLRALGRWRYWGLLVAAPVFGAVAAVRGPRMFLGRNLEVRIPVTRAGVRMPHYDLGPVGRAMLERRDRHLIEALGQIHLQRQHESITVAVVYGAEHIPEVYASLLVHYGYRPGETEWLTAIVAVSHRDRLDVLGD